MVSRRSFGKFASILVAQLSEWVTATALSLLHYLCHELPDYRLALLDVSHLFGYTLGFFVIQR